MDKHLDRSSAKLRYITRSISALQCDDKISNIIMLSRLAVKMLIIPKGLR